MAVATFEGTITLLLHYFDRLNFTFDCHDYIAVTHNRNCNKQFHEVSMLVLSNMSSYRCSN